MLSKIRGSQPNGNAPPGWASEKFPTLMTLVVDEETTGEKERKLKKKIRRRKIGEGERKACLIQIVIGP
jgi:hypothetical protein